MIIELLAGAILATLAIGYVLRPVIRRERAGTGGNGRDEAG